MVESATKIVELLDLGFDSLLPACLHYFKHSPSNGSW